MVYFDINPGSEDYVYRVPLLFAKKKNILSSK